MPDLPCSYSALAFGTGPCVSDFVFTVLHTLGKNWSFVPLVVTARGPRCDEWAVITPFSLPLKPTLHLGLREVPGFTKSLWRKELLNLY